MATTATLIMSGFHGDKRVDNVAIEDWNDLYYAVSADDAQRVWDAASAYCGHETCECGGPAQPDGSTPDGRPLWSVCCVRDVAGESSARQAWAAIGAVIDRLHDMAEPLLIRYEDTGEMEVVPRPHLSDISWSERGRERTILLELDGETLADIMEAFGDGHMVALLEGWLA